MATTPTLRRWLQGTAGVALVALGSLGLVAMLPASVAAQQPDPDVRGHETVHEMMGLMHGEGTATRMHEIEGAEQMMDQCASMMATMDDMDMSRMGQMMRNGGMMERMMDGRGMSSMGRMMGGEMEPGQMSPGMGGMMDSGRG